MIEQSETIVNSIRKVVFQETGFRETSIKIGIPAFDERFHGVRRGQLVLVASKFKCSLDLFWPKLIRNIGVDFGCPTQVFLLDSSTRYLVKRFQSGYGLSIDKLEPEPESMQPVIDRVGDAPIFVYETPRLTLTELQEYLERDKPHVVMVSGADKLVRNENGYDEKSVVEFSKSLKDLAEKHNCVIIIDALFPITVRQGKQKLSWDVRELPFNGAIANDADQVLCIVSPEPTVDNYHVTILKSVHGFCLNVEATLGA